MHENDIIAFNMDKCEQIQSTMLCDYIYHNQNSTNHIDSLLKTETNNVEKICQFKISGQVMPTEFAQFIENK